MKIDMLESLGYSFLRHVQGCWIVQTNWKASLKGLAERAWEPLEARFAKMRDEFGEYASSETLVVAKVSRGLRVRHGPEPPLAGKQDGRTLQEAGARSRISP